jgi:secondary thiamine-phosphate synthase enzyme
MRTLCMVSQRPKQVIGLTERLNAVLAETYPDLHTGIGHLFVAHTTAALTTADLEPGTDRDMLDAFAAMILHLAYRHPHNPAHVPDHILASLIGPSLTVPMQDGALALGTWPHVVLIALDGPRERPVFVAACPA